VFLGAAVIDVSYIAPEEQCDISVQHSEVSFQLHNLVITLTDVNSTEPIMLIGTIKNSTFLQLSFYIVQ